MGSRSADEPRFGDVLAWRPTGGMAMFIAVIDPESHPINGPKGPSFAGLVLGSPESVNLNLGRVIGDPKGATLGPIAPDRWELVDAAQD